MYSEVQLQTSLFIIILNSELQVKTGEKEQQTLTSPALRFQIQFDLI